MFCKYCGSTIDVDSVFCLNCGKNVRECDETAAPINAAKKAPTPTAAPAPAPVKEKQLSDLTLNELKEKRRTLNSQFTTGRRTIRGFAIASLVFLIILAIIVIGSVIRTNTREAIWGASWNSVGEDARNGFACAVGLACVVGSYLSVWIIDIYSKKLCFILAGFYMLYLIILCILSGGPVIEYYWWLLIPCAIFALLAFYAGAINRYKDTALAVNKAIKEKENIETENAAEKILL